MVKMNKQDISKLNQIAENTRQNAKRLDKLINKFRKMETSETDSLKGGLKNEI